MINECKSMVRVLAEAITPMSLKDLSVVPEKVDSRYDWATQESVLTGARWGTTNRTSTGTTTGICNMSDDSNWDSYSD